MKVDINELTLDDLEEAEAALGEPVTQMLAGNAIPVRVLKVFAWVLGKKDNPELTLEEVGQVKVMSFVDEEDPTDASA